MKIIKKGKDISNEDFTYSFICKSCGCEFETTRKDLQEYHTSYAFHISYPCPNCGEITEGVNKRYLEILEVLHGVTLDE